MKFLFSLAFAVPCLCLSAQNSGTGKITISLNGLSAPKAYIGFYYGDQLVPADSSSVDSVGGRMEFSSSALPPGMYFLSANGKHLLDFMVDSIPAQFEIKGDITDPDNFTVLNSPENVDFFEYQRSINEKKNRLNLARYNTDLIRRATSDRQAIAEQEQKLRAITAEITAGAQAFTKEHPGQLFAKMLAAVQLPAPPPELPAFKNDGRPNPEHLRWINRHYWDHTDFTDERLLRNNLSVAYLDAYIDKFTPPHPDSVCASIDRLLSKMPRRGAFFKFTSRYFTQSFETSEWPPSDRVFVHLVDRWQIPDSVKWVDEPTLLRLKAKADLHRYNLTGNPAPPLELPNPDGQMVRLDTIQADFTLLIFYSPLCEHCMAVLPDVYQIWLDAAPYGLKAVAVSTDENYKNWKTFIKQQSWAWYNVADPSGINAFEKPYGAYNLPVLYLLDKHKNIVLKRIKPAELRTQLERFLRKH